jgi:hypothetical protein
MIGVEDIDSGGGNSNINDEALLIRKIGDLTELLVASATHSSPSPAAGSRQSTHW